MIEGDLRGQVDPLAACVRYAEKGSRMRNAPNAARMPHGARTPLELETDVACPRCGRIAAWGALERVEVLDGAALEHQLAVQPDGWFVDVRACGGCGRSFARKGVAKPTR